MKTDVEKFLQHFCSQRNEVKQKVNGKLAALQKEEGKILRGMHRFTYFDFLNKQKPCIQLNPITYGILTFRQLRGGGGGGLFGPDPENKVTINGLI